MTPSATGLGLGLTFAGQLQSLQAALSDAQTQAQAERSRQVIDAALTALAHDRFEEMALAVVNHLAQQQGAGVQLGWLRGAELQALCRSGAAWQDRRAAQLRLAEQAMAEAIDEGSDAAGDGGKPLALCTADQAGAVAVTAALTYARHTGAGALALVVLRRHEHPVGVLLLERSAAFTPAELDTVQAVALMLGPLLALTDHAERSLTRHARERLQGAFDRATDGSHPGRKLIAGGALLALALSAAVPATHRVSAPAVVEGAVQWTAAAPFAGYVRQGLVRAGDSVSQGQVLAELDDRDLQLEHRRWAAELSLAERKEREALAAGQRVEQRLALAQAAQARAQLELTEDRLRRARITAPFDGVVVKGDLSQLQGSPVETGKPLFELAPLDAWRVILKVDERDVAQLRPGQPGEMALVSEFSGGHALRVRRVTSLATAEDGRNYFRVEAEVVAGAGTAPELRPGMEGVAKVDVGSRSLLWLATHRLTDWLRMSAWEWLP
jgi:RND family efflux transporter MFP subunit